MQSDTINDRIVVGAVFGSGSRIKPAWFIWMGRKYKIEETTFAWEERKGSSVHHHFSVSDGANLFELVLDAGSLTWRLRGTEGVR